MAATAALHVSLCYNVATLSVWSLNPLLFKWNWLSLTVAVNQKTVHGMSAKSGRAYM